VAIAVECAHCGKQLKVKDELAGKKGKCPQCQNLIQIPAGAPVAVGAGAFASKPIPKPAAAKSPAAAPAKAAPAPAVSQPVQLTDEQFGEQVLSAFNGQMTPPKVGFGRKFGAMIVLMILSLMPLFFFAVIGALAFAAFFLATNNDIPWPVPALQWVAVAAVGIFLLCLIKSLVEPQRRGEATYPIDLKKDELLREFTTKVCQQIDAPVPKTIEVECSTRFSATKGGSLVTLGLPAVAAMSVDQFACVLANLLALHRPKAGCRVMNMIRGINYWLWRNVYGKSRLDRWLARVAERPHFHAAKLLLPLKATKIPAQMVLFIPMFIANTIAQSAVRAAEFDADRAAARLVGRKTFAAVIERLEQIDFSWDGILADLKFLNSEQQLPDSLPEQVALRMLDMSPELWGALRDTVNAPDEKPFDTKPITPDRLEAVQKEATDGVLRCPLPAAKLFSGFGELSRKMSADFYASRFGSK
jgi:phage FluMu protein Com